MANKKEVKIESDTLAQISEMVSTYEEIAATRMQRVRSSVLQSRDFLNGVLEVFSEVRSSYKSEVEKLIKNKKRAKNSFLKSNGKTVCVLVSANTGLYGEIVGSTYNLFTTTIKDRNFDIVIIGKVGKALFERDSKGREYKYFEMPDNIVDPVTLKKIVDLLIEYEDVIVFYGQFNNVVLQTAVASNVSGNKFMSKDSGKEGQPAIKYFFEPSLEKIMEVFEHEIFASLFEQTIHESMLSKFASRMILLDSAVENIKEKIKKVDFQKQKLKHRVANSKQNSMFSSMSLWRKNG